MNQVRILLVDDNREFLETAAGFLSREPAMVVSGMAGTGEAALEMLVNMPPDLVIMDLSMPRMNGLEATRRIKALPSPPRVVILTLYEGPEFRSFAQAAGADDFVTKSEFGELLVPMIRRFFPWLHAEPSPEWV